MIDLQHRSPARVTARAATAMPRWMLFSLLAAFIVPGLFGHALWPQDATGFARMWSMAHGAADHWLFPDIAGVPAVRDGPLPYWFGAALIRWFGARVGATNAAAAANLFWYPLALGALWHALVRLARRDEALPVPGAFGGDASRRDYARLVADIGLLLAIGTIGLVLRLHQTHADAAAIASISFAMLALSAIETHRRLAAALAGVAVGTAALIQGPILAGGLLIGCLLAFLFDRTPTATDTAFDPSTASVDPGSGSAISVSRSRSLAAVTGAPISALILFVVGLGIAASWPVLGFHFFPREASAFFAVWGRRNMAPDLLLATPHSAFRTGGWLLRTGVWFLWPLWPLAAWAVYAWRGSLRAAHILRPLLLLASIGATVTVSSPIDERFLIDLIPPLVVLAAFGATTLRRGLDNAIDWLAIASLSLALLFLWAYFAAMNLGVPQAMAISVARLVPGFRSHGNVPAQAVAALVTLLWIYLIFWRIVRRPQVLWRGPMLGAAGVVAAWTTANLLYLPAVDYLFGYRDFSITLATQLHAHGWNGLRCVDASRVPVAERAIVSYYGNIPFQSSRDGRGSCRFALQYIARSRSTANVPPSIGNADGVNDGRTRGNIVSSSTGWTTVWQGRRRPRPQAIWRIWKRVP